MRGPFWGPEVDGHEVSSFYEGRLTSFPLLRVKPDKIPRDKGWSSLRRSPAELGPWRKRLIRYHGPLALVTGAGHAVLDVDLDVPGAVESFQRFVRDAQLDTITPTVATPSGGQHLHLRTNALLKSVALVTIGYIGLDFKAEGGFVVVPPTPGYEILDDFDVQPVLVGEQLVELVGRAGDAGGSYEPKDGDLDDNERVALLLQDRFGATIVHQLGDGTFVVRRPGKAEGHSGTVGKVGKGRFKNFSSSWEQFSTSRAYTEGDLRRMLGEGPTITVPPAAATPDTFMPISGVRSRRQRWAWNGIVPLGQLVLGIGQEKLGKSSAMVWVASRLTCGELDGDLSGEPANVVFVSAEDAADTVLKARAVAAGADLERFYVLNPQGEGFILDAVLELKPRLLVLDPFSAFVELPRGGDEPGEVALRRSFLPFHLLAVEHDVTVFGVRHVRKAAGSSNPFDVALGSRAWTAAARGVVFFTPDKGRDDDRGGLLFARGNLAAGSAYRWHLQPKVVRLDDGQIGEVPLFVLDGIATDVSLEELLTDAESVGQLERAKEFLLFHLGEERQRAGVLIGLAESEGTNERTLRRACRSLGVITQREGKAGPEHVVWWVLP